ncbi:MAG: HDIG domain-containing protein [Lachnospiraceae bacterium]|nr:HDIG domain-containing protein [Lachnospiraceae bacterium]
MIKKSKVIICIGILLSSVLGLILGCLLYKDYKMQNEMIIICIYGILLTAFYLWILLQKSDSTHLKAPGFAFLIIFYHVFNLAILIFGMNLPAVYRPICAVPMLLTILFGIKTGLASMVLYSVVTVLFGLDPVEAILLYLIFGVVGSFLAVTFKSTIRLIVGSFSLVAVYAMFYVGLNYYTYGELLGNDFVTGLIGGAVQVLVFLCFFPFVARTINFNLDKKLVAICEDSFKPIEELKDRNPAVYEHSKVVAKLAGHAAKAAGINEKLVKAGALYHEIGQGLGGNYIKKGIEICNENNVPEAVIDIIKEHNINIAKPATKESAIVMLADTIISTMDGMKKKGTPIPDKVKLIDKILALRISKGYLDVCDLTAGDLNKIKDAFCGAWRKKDGTGDVDDLILDEPLEVPEELFE